MAKQAANSVAFQVQDEVIGHAVDVMRYGERTREKVVGLLESLGEDVEGKIRQADVAGIKRTEFKQKRQEALIQQINKTVSTSYSRAAGTLREELIEIADVSKGFSVTMLNNTVFQGEVASTALTRADLKVLVTNAPINGAPQKAWWKKQDENTRQRFAQQIRLGVAQGETNDQLVQRVRGRKTGQTRVVDVGNGKKRIVPVAAGGALDVSKREATALVRTAALTVSNKVQEEVYKENQDVLKGRVAQVTLDGRTSEVCRARSGGAWDFEGDPLPESRVKVKFPGPPPWHFQCRTILVPITKSWEELVEEATGKKKKIKEIPKGTQASMDGQVPADLNYGDWLKTKPEAFQREVLGEGRYRLWKDGKLSLAEMVDQQGRPLTLSQLKARIGVHAGQSVSEALEGVGGALPGKGSWEGFGSAELIRLAGNQGLTPQQTTVLMERLGLNPAKNTVYIQLKEGAKGVNLPQLTEDQRKLFASLTPTQEEAVKLLKNKRGVTPPPIQPPVKPRPTVLPAVPPAFDEVVGNLRNRAAFEQKLTEAANTIPEHVRITLQNGAGVKVRVGDKLTTIDPSLAGLTPRGWPPGSTWDNADGIFHISTRSVVATEQYIPFGSRKYELSRRVQGVYRHEYGHAVDWHYAEGLGQQAGKLSDRPSFRSAYAKDAAVASQGDRNALSYFFQSGEAGRQEAFAEGFAQLFGGGTEENKALFAKVFPNTLKEIKALVDPVPITPPVIPVVPVPVANSTAVKVFARDVARQNQGRFVADSGLGGKIKTELGNAASEARARAGLAAADYEVRVMRVTDFARPADRPGLKLEAKRLAARLKKVADGADLPSGITRARPDWMPAVVDETGRILQGDAKLLAAMINGDEHILVLAPTSPMANGGLVRNLSDLHRFTQSSRLEELLLSVDDLKARKIGGVVVKPTVAQVPKTPIAAVTKTTAEMTGTELREYLTDVSGGSEIAKLLASVEQWESEHFDLKSKRERVNKIMFGRENRNLPLSDRREMAADFLGIKKVPSRVQRSDLLTDELEAMADREVVLMQKKSDGLRKLHKDIHKALTLDAADRIAVKPMAFDEFSGGYRGGGGVKPLGPSKVTSTPTFQEGQEFFGKVVSNKHFGGELQFEVGWLDTNSAFARMDQVRVYFHKSEDAKVIAHEIAHLLEIQPSVLNKSKAFLKKRAMADPKGLQKLKDITGSSGYQEWELAWEDKFINPYMGKDYTQATEILSMGVEMLLSDPIRLLRKDPEMFEFVVNVLRGY